MTIRERKKENIHAQLLKKEEHDLTFKDRIEIMKKTKQEHEAKEGGNEFQNYLLGRSDKQTYFVKNYADRMRDLNKGV